MAVLKEVQSKFKTKKEYRVLILEDNLEATAGLTPQVVSSVARFLRQQEDTRWDVFHLVTTTHSLCSFCCCAIQHSHMRNPFYRLIII